MARFKYRVKVVNKSEPSKNRDELYTEKEAISKLPFLTSVIYEGVDLLELRVIVGFEEITVLREAQYDELG